MVEHNRLERVRARLREEGVDALLVGPSADLRWLIGYHALPLERLTLLVVPADGDPTLVVPELEVPRVREMRADEHADVRHFGEVEDPYALVVDAVPAGAGTIGVQDRLWTQFTLDLQRRLPAERWVPGSTVVGPLRIVKDADELAALHAVGGAIDRVHARLPGWLRPGRTEREVGRDVAEAILEEHDEVNFVIVASGPNGASPHHETGDRVIEDGDAVVVDIGGTMDGYCSDMTRNYVVGTPDPEYLAMHEVLVASQRAGVEAVVPGATAEQVDAAARAVLDDAGWGEWFVHRTGHGIGVEEHEAPWIVSGNDLPLRPGMAFSVEPGVYVPDRWGARIEDIVTVGDDGGARPANHLPHDVVVVDA